MAPRRRHCPAAEWRRHNSYNCGTCATHRSPFFRGSTQRSAVSTALVHADGNKQPGTMADGTRRQLRCTGILAETEHSCRWRTISTGENHVFLPTLVPSSALFFALSFSPCVARGKLAHVDGFITVVGSIRFPTVVRPYVPSRCTVAEVFLNSGRELGEEISGPG